MGEFLHEEGIEEIEKRDRKNYLNTLDIDSGEIKTIVLDSKESQEILAGKRPEIFSVADLESLSEIEKNSFGEELQEEPEDLLEEIQSGGNILFFIREKGELAGYLFAKPADKAYENFVEVGLPSDDFDASKNNLYVEAIAGKLGVFARRIYHYLENQAAEIGYSKISLHAINPNLAELLKKEGFVSKKEIQNWLGHRAEYLEKEINQKELKKI